VKPSVVAGAMMDSRRSESKRGKATLDTSEFLDVIDPVSHPDFRDVYA
jgi:hypothetical protein